MDSIRVKGATEIPSYMAASVTYSATAAATVVFEIGSPAATASNNPGKIVRVHRIIFSAIQTTAGNIGDWRLEKRALSTGGTSVSMTAVPLDSAQPASVASVLSYTNSPTPGTLVGIIYQPRMMVPQASSVLQPASVFDFDTTKLMNGKPITLRPGQAISLNFGGGALPTGLASCQVSVYWTEEPLTASPAAYRPQ